jgi:hypothetical protein
MSVQPALRYNPPMDETIGFQDMGENERSSDCANQLFVLMIRGVYKPMKQPIGYAYVCHNMEPPTIKDIVADAVSQLHDSGLHVRRYFGNYLLYYNRITFLGNH